MHKRKKIGLGKQTHDVFRYLFKSLKYSLKALLLY